MRRLGYILLLATIIVNNLYLWYLIDLYMLSSLNLGLRYVFDLCY